MVSNFIINWSSIQSEWFELDCNQPIVYSNRTQDNYFVSPKKDFYWLRRYCAYILPVRFTWNVFLLILSISAICIHPFAENKQNINNLIVRNHIPLPISFLHFCFWTLSLLVLFIVLFSCSQSWFLISVIKDASWSE